ncbi:uncharacterized protein LOC143007776 isoform X2 [Genypterus blacodes]|uniref:uncharacterized protein LOC143007776 isoform X2 n=1 Tax=Genypterus blacodes TaxID=154954 RepID=UPI003F7628BA
MERLSSQFLLAFCFLTFVCIDGKRRGVTSSCAVEVRVRRGQVWAAVPHQELSITCPVRHCGQALQITWCRRVDTGTCVQLNDTESIEITQHNKSTDQLISSLIFKRISISDNGLYRCGIREYENEHIGHLIYISVSDSNQEADNLHNNANSGFSQDIDVGAKATEVIWAPYLYICMGALFVVMSLVVIANLSSDSCKGMTTNKRSDGQEMATRALPDVPKWSTLSDPRFSLSPDLPHADAGASCSTQGKPGELSYTTIKIQLPEASKPPLNTTYTQPTLH